MNNKTCTLELCQSCRWNEDCTKECHKKGKNDCGYYLSSSGCKDNIPFILENTDMYMVMCNYYSDWKEDRGCHVKKGEKYISCPLKPHTYCPFDVTHKNFNYDFAESLVENYLSNSVFQDKLSILKKNLK